MSNSKVPGSVADQDALDLAKAMTQVQMEAAKKIVADVTGKDGVAPDPALVGQVAQTIAINQAIVTEKQKK